MHCILSGSEVVADAQILSVAPYLSFNSKQVFFFSEQVDSEKIHFLSIDGSITLQKYA